ncbi:MAG: hypothetical protein HXS44_08910 [Theionarchaea archaeon]|nr:hypothetical protein [Theionarchaea archaeon]
MTMVSPKEMRRQIILKLYEAFNDRKEHSLTKQQLMEDIGLPEWVVEASLLYMDAKGWMSSLLPSALRISPAGVDLVEDRERFLEEFESLSNVVLVIVDSEVEGSLEGGFEKLYEEVGSSVLSEEEKEEVSKLLEMVEKKCEEMGGPMEELGKGMVQVLEKAEWLRPYLHSVVCRKFLGNLKI